MKIKYIAVVFLFVFLAAAPCSGARINKLSKKPAIVLAVFGTSHVSALPGILDIYHSVEQAFPGVEVRLSFTSNIIRRIWRKRRHDQVFLDAHPEVPQEVLMVKGTLASIADLQDEGYGYIIVQPTHIAAAEEYTDLTSYVAGLNSIRTIKKRNSPFRKIILGRPALGVPGIAHEYHHDIERAARALAVDVDQAEKNGAALVYMGHGNDHFSTGVYLEFAEVMGEIYPQIKTYVSMVEGFPSNELLFRELKRDKVGKVYLKTLMTVAGDHAKNDMAGDEDDSLKTQLLARGYEVEVNLQGLGQNKEFAAIFVDNIKDAAKDNGLEL